MAKDVSSEGELHVSKCHCETGRNRHHIPKSIQIPFETSQTVGAPDQDHDSDDGSADESTASDEPVQDDLLDEETFFVGEPFGEADVLAQELLGPLLPDEEFPLIDPEDWGDDEQLEIDIGLFAAQEAAANADGFLEDEAPPRIATWRLNLTALSQFYNIYIVAYANKIYVSRPRSCVTNVLPAEPDLILQPQPSMMALRIGGYLDESFPHQINHLIIGELGNEEILLLAYDDGDVIGYYTRHIEEELLRREKDSKNETTPIPFFHENVQKSAWGLAIHKKSRLIAVSSNLHKVSVFVFALTGQEYRHTAGVDTVEFFRTIVKDENGNILDTAKPRHLQVADRVRPPDPKVIALESAIRRRDANWRILLETGLLGANIPNVAFSDDEYGEADKVVAVDINGKLYIMDIWCFNKVPHIVIDPLHRGRRTRLHGHHDFLRKPRGWGVLVLPESSFLPTKNLTDSLGLPLREVKFASDDNIGRWIDISQATRYLKNNSNIHPWMRSGNAERFAFNPLEPRRNLIDAPWYEFNNNAPTTSLYDLVQNSYRLDGRRSRLDQINSRAIVKDRSSILRTYELDIELRSFEENGIGVMLEKAINQSRPSQAVLPSMRVSHERLANLIHVPELSLVVAGSLCGRVALLTLTRPEGNDLFLKRAFKIEAILPTKRDEDNKMRPICPLLGVAIGPAPFSGNEDLADKPLGQKRYRIMLHYYDLRILSYELYRTSATDSLSIV